MKFELNRAVTATALVVVVSACATYDVTPGAAPTGVPKLGAQEIRSFLQNARSLKDALPGDEGFRYALGPDDAISTRMPLRGKIAGKWSVEGDRLCFSFVGYDKMCGDVYRLDDQHIYVFMPNWSKEHSTLTVQR
jgi:hypothetical protein